MINMGNAMKVILSRKGFDSAHGGFASPIFSDNRMLSLPVPGKNDRIKYFDLLWENGITYYDLMKDLHPKNGGEIRSNGKWEPLSKETTCHFDPDIRSNAKERLNGWKGLFGQADAAQGHLYNNEIGEDDLFLFFGWFKRATNNSGKWEYVPKDDKHVIFGYLQVQEIVNKKEDLKHWMMEHPHADLSRWKAQKNNTMYAAREKLSWDENFPGWGTFDYHEDLVLTKAGLTRSFWKPNPVFKDAELSYNKTSWKEEYFKSAAIGQEFILLKDEHENFLNWAKNLIKKHAKRIG